MTPPSRESKPFRIALAKAVRMRRAEKDLTQDDVAALAEISRKTIGEIEAEQGNPQLDTIDRLAGVLGLQVVISGEAA